MTEPTLNLDELFQMAQDHLQNDLTTVSNAPKPVPMGQFMADVTKFNLEIKNDLIHILTKYGYDMNSDSVQATLGVFLDNLTRC